MGSPKLNIRRRLIDKKEIYDSNGDTLLAIDIAVEKAYYIAIGGQKAVIMPKYLDAITIMAIDLVKLKDKGYNFILDKEKVIKHIDKNFKLIDSISLQGENRDKVRIEIKGREDCRQEIEYQEFISLNNFIDIMVYIIRLNTPIKLTRLELRQLRFGLTNIMYENTLEI